MIVLSPGSRWETKRWPVPSYAELIRRMRLSCPGSVLLIGSADEAVLGEQLLNQLGNSGMNNIRNWIGKTEFTQLLALISSADMVIANDSGPLHLAVALGKPVLAPYTCTKVELHGPYGSFKTAVQTQVSCAGSYIRQCSHMSCMKDLTPDRLWPIFAEMLQQWSLNNRLL